MIPRCKYWSCVFAWTALIYSTLSVARPVCTFLKNTTPFALLMNSLLIILLMAVSFYLASNRKVRRPSTYLLLIMTVAAYAYGLSVIQVPEEKIHFIEYGVLSCLILRALKADYQSRLAYFMAFTLTAILGWIDEGIQFLLPNRYYQIDDVMLNMVSGLLGLLLAYIGERDRAVVGGNPSDKMAA